MIIGLVTLFATLFFGGSQQYFFIEKLEKGVKEYVVEKERKKEILIDLKTVKSTIKGFNKERKKSLGVYHDLNTNYQSTPEEFETFLFGLSKERIEFQKMVVNQRLQVVAKITKEEWEEIIGASSNATDKRLNKEAKKKEKDAFEKVKKTINTEIEEENIRSKAIEALATVEMDFNKLRIEFSSVNALENDLLVNKDTTTEDALKLTEELNELRKNLHKSILTFHFNMKDLTAETEWTKIMKSMNKVLN